VLHSAVLDNDFYNANIYSEYKNDQAYRDFYWNTMGDNLKPDNPTAAELALYQEREIIRLTNAAKDALSGAIPGIMAGAAGTIVKNSGQSKNTANSNKIDQAASSTGTESVKGANNTGPVAPVFKGSGPVPGVIAVTDNTSVGVLKNYNPAGGIEFVFDPTTNTFAVGKPASGLFDGSPHQQLVQSISLRAYISLPNFWELLMQTRREDEPMAM